VVEELMARTAIPTSVGLVAMVVAGDRAADLPAIVDRFLELSAAERQRDVAEVRSAVPLDDHLRERLAEALSRAVGKEVEVKVVVDPAVLGGVVARVGDTVIDGTIRHRLEELKERIS
jgi:F-type H+-transporting ATPase subunit delta